MDRKQIIDKILERYTKALEKLKLQELRDFVNDWFGESIKGETRTNMITYWVDDKYNYLQEYTDEALNELLTQEKLV